MDANMQLTINSFGSLFPDTSLTFPWLLAKSLTFPWQLSNSLTFPGMPDKWSPCTVFHRITAKQTFVDWNNMWMTKFRLNINFSLNVKLFFCTMKTLLCYHLYGKLQNRTNNKRITSSVERKVQGWGLGAAPGRKLPGGGGGKRAKLFLKIHMQIQAV